MHLSAGRNSGRLHIETSDLGAGVPGEVRRPCDEPRKKVGGGIQGHLDGLASGDLAPISHEGSAEDRLSTEGSKVAAHSGVARAAALADSQADRLTAARAAVWARYASTRASGTWNGSSGIPSTALVRATSSAPKASP